VPPRAQAAHQQASHLAKQLARRLRGQPVEPYVYRDFGSLVTLGSHETVGALAGMLGGRNLFIEGLVARLMYRSLYKMHETALHGVARATLGMFGRKPGPVVKLH
jgi:NADH dehydrogenase